MKKILSCMLSFVPMIMIGISLLFLLMIAIFIGERTMSTGETIFMVCMLLFELVAVVLTFVLMILYIVKTIKNPYMSTGMKALWCVLLYCLNIFVFPIFWFTVIRKEE